MLKTLVTLSATAMLALPARADEPSSAVPPAKALFEQLDTNHDGLLAADEIPDERATLFDRLVRKCDRNDDGQLTVEEFAAGLSPDVPSETSEKTADPSETPEPAKAEQPSRPKKPAKPAKPGKPPRPRELFERLDANDDGQLTLDEIPEPGRERFERLLARADEDNDGAITRREFSKAGPPGDESPQGAKPAKAAKPAKPEQPGKPPRGQRPGEGFDAARFFERMDRNGDGKVVADEIPDERREGFERMIQRGDKDDDAALSLEEFKAVFGRRPMPPGKAPAAPGRAFSPAGQPGLFAALDADGDGRLDSGEIDQAAEAIRKLDRDGDGIVTGRELAAAGGKKNK